jgi:DNA ligase-4
MSSRDERELTGPVDTAELSRTTTEEDRLLANMAGEGFNDEASYNDENVEYELDDDPDAEGDDPVAAKPPEPSYKKANAIPFFVVCKKMEDLWQLKGRNGKKPKYKPNEEQKLRHFLPPKLMQSLAESADGRTNESIFPLFRLLMPDQDASRRVMLKEALLANIYGEAFGMPKGSGDRQKLEHFTDAQKFPAGAQVGDFSVVLQRVIEPRFEDPTKGSKLTVGEMNALLDELASLSGKDNNSKDTLRKRRGDWVGKLIKKHVSPLEHKWLTRIIMGKMEFGLGYKPLLRWYHPLAITLWTSHNSLKAVCNKLCDAESAEIRAMMTGEKDANGGKEQVGLASYMPTFRLPIKIGVYFSPMKSERTGFQRVLSDVSKRHRGFLESEEGKGLGVDWSLAVKHPAFCIETKLDGDRMLVHIQRGGIVKIHSRSANWFRYDDTMFFCSCSAVSASLTTHFCYIGIVISTVLFWDPQFAKRSRSIATWT